MYKPMPETFKTVCYIYTRIRILTETLYHKCNGWKIYPAYGFTWFSLFFFFLIFFLLKSSGEFGSLHTLLCNHISQTFYFDHWPANLLCHFSCIFWLVWIWCVFFPSTYHSYEYCLYSPPSVFFTRILKRTFYTNDSSNSSKHYKWSRVPNMKKVLFIQKGGKRVTEVRLVIFTHLFRSGWSFLQEKENRRGEGVFLLSSFFIKEGGKKEKCLPSRLWSAR